MIVAANLEDKKSFKSIVFNADNCMWDINFLKSGYEIWKLWTFLHKIKLFLIRFVEVPKEVSIKNLSRLIFRTQDLFWKGKRFQKNSSLMPRNYLRVIFLLP